MASIQKDLLMPLSVGSGIYGGLFLLGATVFPFFFQREYRGLARVCFMLTFFCMWIFWLIVFLAQVNPLIGPRYTQRTLSWIAYKWGDPV